MLTILAPLDGTPGAECAFVGITALAAGQPARVHFLYVGADADGQHQAALVKAAGLFRELGYETSVHVQAGDPATEIPSVARLVRADVLILKRDEREGIAGWVLGSITDKIARNLPCPLLLINPLPGDQRWHDYRVRRILVPLDGSERAEAGVHAALDLADRLGAAVTVVYAVPWLQTAVTAVPEIAAVGSISPYTDAALEASLRSYLSDVQRRVGPRRPLATVAMRGRPADAVLAAARTHKADLIVMTTQGAGRLVHPGLGSVAEHVSTHSSVPVLLVPGHAGAPAAPARREGAAGMAEPITEALARTVLFRGLSADDLRRLRDVVQRLRFPAQHAITHQGGIDTGLYVILTGSVDVIRDRGSVRETRIATLGPGEFFGELALLLSRARTATVVTREPTEVAMLVRADFRQQSLENPAMLWALMEALAERLNDTEERLGERD